MMDKNISRNGEVLIEKKKESCWHRLEKSQKKQLILLAIWTVTIPENYSRKQPFASRL
jgi:hypothetical protein